jgi:hypothetical protein
LYDFTKMCAVKMPKDLSFAPNIVVKLVREGN